MAMPIHKIKFGGITVNVWENTGKGTDGQSFTSTSAQLSKSYQDKDQKWVNVNFSFKNTTEIINTIQALEKFLEWKYQKTEPTNQQPVI